MNTRREIDGRHGEKGMDPVETNHIFQNVPMTRSTPGKKKTTAMTLVFLEPNI